eukprot:m.153741 g.153741  ORF g.153741 m.153741 type:complete len:173 (-) comp52868_c0_seq1:40-558(-)
MSGLIFRELQALFLPDADKGMLNPFLGPKVSAQSRQHNSLLHFQGTLPRFGLFSECLMTALLHFEQGNHSVSVVTFTEERRVFMSSNDLNAYLFLYRLPRLTVGHCSALCALRRECEGFLYWERAQTICIGLSDVSLHHNEGLPLEDFLSSVGLPPQSSAEDTAPISCLYNR